MAYPVFIPVLVADGGGVSSASGYASAPAPPAAAITSYSSPGGPDGSVTFDVTPSTAEVWADGWYLGLAGTFSAAPALLSPGAHYVELRAPGFRTAAGDVIIHSQTTTRYRAMLQPVR